MGLLDNLRGWLKIIYVVFAFCSAFFVGALKGLLVGPVAGLIMIAGNVGVILGLFPSHVYWTIYTLVMTNRFDIPLKVAILFALPALFGIWLGLSIAGSVIVGVGYGFFTPWVSAFEAFRHGDECKKFVHCIVDGTWGTIKGSCTVVTDFADLCYHSYPLYLKELRESSSSEEIRTLRLIHVPGSILVGLMGLVVDIPLVTAIAVVKSPFLLLKGWFRFSQDLINREGPFLETACVPFAGLTILMWPIIVVGFILLSIFASFFFGLYGAVVVYQERSFRRGVAYVIAIVAEFDEYTNDLLYLREGTVLPRPRYRKRRTSHSTELSARGYPRDSIRAGSFRGDASGMIFPTLTHSSSIREAIQEVKMVQIWDHTVKSCEMRGKELLDAGIITLADLQESLKPKNTNEATIVFVGLPCYTFLQIILSSIKAGSNGLLLLDGFEMTHMNRPKDKLLDWFFNPFMVLKEQIRVLKLVETETRYLEKSALFESNVERMQAWENRGKLPEDALRAAQIQGISRRMSGMMRSMSKLPTYRRRFKQVAKSLIAYSMEKEGFNRSISTGSGDSIMEV